jgi:branched-chain amino acid transport system ATP-binding protein
VNVLEVEGVVAGYGRVEALHGVSLTVAEGEAVTTIGANGAGKTTLLKTVAGLIRPRRGRILLDGTDVTGWPAERRARHGIALVPEGRQVFPEHTTRDNLLLGAYGRRRSGDVDEDLAKVEGLFPILLERRGQLAGTLSGGQQQMLAIGRALMSRPKVLLLDEPSLGLAPLAVKEVVDRLVELAGAGSTLVLVEQNAAAAFRVASRGYVLDRGDVVVEGPITELRNDPRVHTAYLGQPS